MSKLAYALVLLGAAFPAPASNHPFTVSGPLISPTPFSVTLPSTLPDGWPARTAVIEFFTANCQDATGTSDIGVAPFAVFFRPNNFFRTLRFGPAMSFVNGTDFAASEKTLIFADPGTPLNFGLTAAEPACTVVFPSYLD